MIRISSAIAALLTGMLIAWTQQAAAQTPIERAAKIKEWRQNCNDPDPDLRMAFLESAIAGKDQTVIRTCVKQLLLSDNDDVRNLAIRAGLASAERVVIQFSESERFKQAMANAGSDTAKIDRVNKDYRFEVGILGQTGGMITLAPIEVSMSSQSSRWYSNSTSAATSDRNTAELNLVGSRLTVTGTAHPNIAYLFSATLNDQGFLEGTGKLKHALDLPITLKLY